MQFIPDYRNFEAVMRNERPSRLPLYEHIVSPTIMELVMGVRFAELEEGNTCDQAEYFRHHCRFFEAMTYDTVSYEVCISRVLPGPMAICGGSAREFTDSPPSPLTKPYALPGMVRNGHRPEVPAYEYAVSAVNGFGEGDKSHPVTTNPASWLVWQPAGPTGYSRRSAFWEPPYVPAHMMPPENYPCAAEAHGLIRRAD